MLTDISSTGNKVSTVEQLSLGCCGDERKQGRGGKE